MRPAYHRIDTIVRVEARRLRKKLEAYYERNGAADLVRIEIPGPGYVPQFRIAVPKALRAAVGTDGMARLRVRPA